MIDEVTYTILKEIDDLLKSGVLPVSNDHLKKLASEIDILARLIAMKDSGLISGDLIKIGSTGTPHRMTNIRLTYQGIRKLRRDTDGKVLIAVE